MTSLRFSIKKSILCCTLFSLVLSSPTNTLLQNVNDSLIQTALYSLNDQSSGHQGFTSAILISAQQLGEPADVTHRLKFNLNFPCKNNEESCPVETCTIDLKRDEVGTVSVQRDSIQCIYLRIQSSEDNIGQEQKESGHENSEFLKNVNKQIVESISSTLDVKPLIKQNETPVRAVQNDGSNYCPGCSYDLNPNLPGFLAFNRQIEKQMDEIMPNNFKHMVIGIVRASRAVPPSSNIIQYQLLVKVGELSCFKNVVNPSDCTLQSNVPIKTCLITFEEQPFQHDNRRITKNNCTAVSIGNGEFKKAQSLVSESQMTMKHNNQQQEDNAYEGLKSILLDDLIQSSTINTQEDKELVVTEDPFVKLVLNKSNDEESQSFTDKVKEFEEFLKDFDLPINKANNNADAGKTPVNEEKIVQEKASVDNENENFNSQNNIIDNIVKSVDDLDTSVVQEPNVPFRKEKRSSANPFTHYSTVTRRKREVPLVGGHTRKDINDPEIIQYANLGLTKLSENFESTNEPILVEIKDATMQIVSGSLYKINVKFGVSDCPKGKKENCQLKDGSELKDCLITVWSQPWLDHGSPKVEVNCDRNARRKRELKGSNYSQKMLAQAESRKHERMFKEFVASFNKNYSSEKERKYRFKIFKKNLKTIEKLQTYEQGTADYGVTMFADLTYEEFKKHHLGLRPDLRVENQIPIPQAEIPDIELPAEFDWRRYKAVTPVKDQGQCGSCWAFSVTGNVEGQYAIKHGKLLSLSEQELVDCDKLDSGCEGGLPDSAYRAIESLGGLELESDYPYDGEDEKCHFNITKAHVEVISAVNITSNEDQMAKWLVKNGPVSIGINANAMQFYMGGISHPFNFLCSPDNLDHGVLIVGYGIRKYPLFNKEIPYWTIKNSWGPRWGEQGYYRVYRGGGTCGLNKMVTSAVVA